MSLQMKAALAGIFFGIWPLFMNRSGLSGNVSSAIFSLGTLVILLPVAIASNNGMSLPSANWLMVGTACILAAFGLLSFNGMLAGASPKEVGTLFVIMIVVQTATPAMYSIVLNGGMNWSKMCGFVAAIIAAVLLTK